MKTALNKCPVCDGELTVTRLHCETCDTAIEGRFANAAFAGLTPEQMDFIETYFECRGGGRRPEVVSASAPTAPAPAIAAQNIHKAVFFRHKNFGSG